MKFYELLLSISLIAANVAYCAPFDDVSEILNQQEVQSIVETGNKILKEEYKAYSVAQKRLVKDEKKLEKLNDKLLSLETESSNKKHSLKGAFRRITGKTSAAQAEKLRQQIKQLETSIETTRKEIEGFENQHADTYQTIENVLQKLYPVFIEYDGNLKSKNKDVKDLKKAVAKLDALIKLMKRTPEEDQKFKKKFVKLYAELAEAFAFVPKGPEVPERKKHTDTTGDDDKTVADIS